MPEQYRSNKAIELYQRVNKVTMGLEIFAIGLGALVYPPLAAFGTGALIGDAVGDAVVGGYKKRKK